MGITYTVYTVAAFALAVFLAARTDRKFLGFVLTFWVLAQPVLGSEFMLHLPGFDLSPNRMLLLALVGYFVFSNAIGRKGVGDKTTTFAQIPFERYLYIYLVIVIVSLAYNLASVRPQDIVVAPLHIVTFIVAYLTTKKFATQKVLEAIIAAVIILAVTGAFISFIQFAVDDTFLRTGEVRGAFREVKRATGIFTQEYDFGAVQILGVMVTIFRFRRSFITYLFVPVLAMSVLLTFHRLDIIVLAVCLITYFLFYTDAKRKALLVFVLVAISVVYPLIDTMLEKSTVVTTLEGRIGQNTVTGRLAQYQVAAMLIFTDYTLVGLGTYENPAYDERMKLHGMMNYDEFGKAVGAFRIHNGYLEVGILYGVLAMFAYTLFLFSMLRYFKKRSFRKSQYSALPMFVVLIYMLINISNGMSSFNFYVAVLCAMLAGSFVMYHRRHAQEAGSVQADIGGERRVLYGARSGRSGKRVIGASQ